MEGESRRKKSKSRTLQGNCNDRKARLPKAEDEKERSLIASFRCGNEVKGRQHWREEKNRRCKICKEEEETLEHVIGRCKATKGDLRVKEVLKGTREGLEQMKRIQRERKRRNTEEANEQVEERRIEGMGGIDIQRNAEGRRRKN